MAALKCSLGAVLTLAVAASALFGLAWGARISHNAAVDPKHQEILALAPGKLGQLLSLVDSQSSKEESHHRQPEIGAKSAGDHHECHGGSAACHGHGVAGAKAPPGEFIPTHEWQIVEEGQMIPAGLHIRMNLSTGKKEAKLLT